MAAQLAGRCVPRLALLAGALRQAGAWRTWGMLPTESEFTVYVGKFCFDFRWGKHLEAARFEFVLHGHVLSGPHENTLQSSEGPPCWGPCETQGNLYLLVFDDEKDHWKRVHQNWDELTCEEGLHYASSANKISLSRGEFNRTVYVQQSGRPAFRYFAFAACGVTVVDPVSYEIHAENVLQGFQREFGIDERGGLQLQLLAFAMFATLTAILRQVARRATGAEALRSRPLLRLLLLSALCSAAGAALLALHLSVCTLNGYGLALLEVMGEINISCAKALLTLLQLLTAKGWALFYAPEEMVQRRVMMCLLGGIIATSVACEVHGKYFLDWSSSLYLYESWPGLVILLLNIVLFAEACRSMRETYRHETSEEVRIFYVVISGASFLYFLSLPVTCLLAAALVPWVRFKYVSRAEVLTRFISTLLLAFCLRPSRLDAMVNARLEEGLETVGEPSDEIEDELSMPRSRSSPKDHGDSDDLSERLTGSSDTGPAE